VYGPGKVLWVTEYVKHYSNIVIENIYITPRGVLKYIGCVPRCGPQGYLFHGPQIIKGIFFRPGITQNNQGCLLQGAMIFKGIVFGPRKTNGIFYRGP